MSKSNNGLRFDIYERVHLPENVAAIDELEEIELVPRIQVIDQGENAVLQGQLVLNGIYRAQGSQEEQVALEHWIPVEITLPMNRVTKLDEVTVDIDTFDVVLLSSRALNLTGILSLRGISLEEEQEDEGWGAEVFTASHSRQDYENAFDFAQANAYGNEFRSEDQQEENAVEMQSDEQSGEHGDLSVENDQSEIADFNVAQFATEQQASREEGQFSQQYEQQYSQQYNEQYSEGDEQQHEQQLAHRYEQQAEQMQQRYVQAESSEAIDEQQHEQLYEQRYEQQEAIAQQNVSQFEQQYIQLDNQLDNEPDERQDEPYVQQAEAPIHWTEQSQQQWSAWESAETEEADVRLMISGDEAEELQEQQSADDESREQDQGDNQLTASAPAATAERELHIALNGNTAQNEAQGLRTILNSSIREQAAQQAASLLQQQEQEKQQQEQEKQRGHEEDIEWQQLFISKRAEQNEFKRIRMCIVQKEDTLERIATKYSVSPRELLQRNNLHESAITEGQLLYIP